VLRGGSWLGGPGNVSSSFRTFLPPDYADYIDGFRVARTP
jgi:formylglycine-generating enzyme required for sulfatase activity